MHTGSVRTVDARRGSLGGAPWQHAGFPPGWTGQGKRHLGRYFWLQPARPSGCASAATPDYLLKGIHQERGGDRWLGEMLQREAWIGMHVSHPHLVPVLELTWAGDLPVVVMPYLQGTDLAAVLQSTRRCSIPQALWIGRQLADALQVLHEAGWVHGDITPSNVLIDGSGHATLIDLGSAAPIGRPDPARGRLLAGTLEYAAPERFTPHAPIDGRSDLYSLGMLLYRMLSGRLPFEGCSVADWGAHHRATPVPDPGTLTAGIPAEVAQLVLQLVAKEPLRRPTTAAELADRLVELELRTLPMRLQRSSSIDSPR